MLNTEIAIPPKYWITKNLSISNMFPEEHSDYEALSESLQNMLWSVEDLITIADKQGIIYKGTFIKQTFNLHIYK